MSLGWSVTALFVLAIGIYLGQRFEDRASSWLVGAVTGGLVTAIWLLS